MKFVITTVFSKNCILKKSKPMPNAVALLRQVTGLEKAVAGVYKPRIPMLEYHGNISLKPFWSNYYV
ncbi:MAG: hypothetical protein HKM93_05905 [Desulfobacteraceae bacterium]|nr:hypothetical protein [Desulfobacteraceae bacterium]